MGCGGGKRGTSEWRKEGGGDGGMRKVGERGDELTDFFSSFRYQGGGGGLRAKIFPPRVSDHLKAVAAAARAAPRNPRATPPPTSQQDRNQILPSDRDRGQIHQAINQINNKGNEESLPAPLIFFTRDGPSLDGPSLAPASFFTRKGPRRCVVMINGERRVMTTYFPLPPGAVIVEEDEEELEIPPLSSSSSKVTSSSLNNKKMRMEEIENKAASEEKKPRTTLTAAESRAYYYKRVPDDNKWQPPNSHHKLIQESHYSDPWRVLIICILLNRTTGTQVKKMLDKFFSLCPNAEAATKVSEEELLRTIWPLGLYYTRTETIKRFSREYLESEWTHVTQLYGIGKYAADAYAMFCMGAVEEVNPHDHKLVKYWQFLCKWRAQERRKQLARGVF